MPLHFAIGDISTFEADAIVSSSSSMNFDEESRNSEPSEADSEEECPIGQVRVTSGDGLKCKYIIHTVSPVWKDGSEYEAEFLILCYHNSLYEAVQLGCKSIIFTLISAENNNFPVVKAKSIAISAIEGFLEDNDCIDVYLLSDEKDEKDFSMRKKTKVKLSGHIKTKGKIHKAILFIKNLTSFGKGKIKNKLKPIYRAFKFPFFNRNKKYMNLDSILSIEVETFSQKLLNIIKLKEMSESDCYKTAGISRQHFSKIRSDKNYNPTKKTVFAFAIALHLTEQETIDLLNSAGYSFGNNKFDLIIQFFIYSKEYDMTTINEALYHYGQEVLPCAAD